MAKKMDERVFMDVVVDLYTSRSLRRENVLKKLAMGL
jgi:hypothetical protein